MIIAGVATKEKCVADITGSCGCRFRELEMTVLLEQFEVVEQVVAQILEEGENGVVETTDGTIFEVAINTAVENLFEQEAALVIEESVSQYMDNDVDQDIEVDIMRVFVSDSNVELEAEVNLTKNWADKEESNQDPSHGWQVQQKRKSKKKPIKTVNGSPPNTRFKGTVTPNTVFK
ncbi:hypothetical protein IFM89_034525 [Coptis chinensis]|uniref:Uncharacterized protein n=1 Tax=Coptis chinensis TaxID=261450 RepID=A0A835HRZ9_9MAGN|nr:hypothetical protein IFM89_034525 [Coptis chinensis]